jgi:hypothetical protein
MLEIDLTNDTFKTIKSCDPQDFRGFIGARLFNDVLYFSCYADSPAVTAANGDEAIEKPLGVDLSNLKKTFGKCNSSVNSFDLSEQPGFTINELIDDINAGLYKDKTYFDEYTKSYASYNAETSRRIIKNCKDFLKRRNRENGN